MTTPVGDRWDAGKTYEDVMGRWSRPLLEEFVRWVGLPPGGHWLDVGTGTEALATAIYVESGVRAMERGVVSAGRNKKTSMRPS